MSWVGSDRIGSGRVRRFSNSYGSGHESPLPNPTRPDLTRELGPDPFLLYSVVPGTFAFHLLISTNFRRFLFFLSHTGSLQPRYLYP